MAKRKYSPFLPTQTKKVVDRRKNLNENHVRLSKSMIDSNAFKHLSANGMKLYFKLRLKFYVEEGKKNDFELSQIYATKLLELSEKSKRSGERAITDLCKNGFIEPTYISKGGGKKAKLSNRYKFSENWKDIE